MNIVAAPVSRLVVLPRAPSLAAQVGDAIVDAVASGRLEFGERLVETDLARQLDVSRVPVREAIKMLEAQGLVAGAPHRGSRIVEFGETKIDHICRTRVALERLAIPDAVANFALHPGRIALLEEQIARMEQESGRQDWIATSKADLEFHRQICVASENEIVLTLWETLARHVLIVFGREIRTERDGPQLVRQHRRLVKLIRKGDSAALDHEIGEHIMRLRRRRERAPVLAAG